MRNFAGQEIDRGDFVIQIARTNQGMVRRVGVVLGYGDQTDDRGTLLRVGWFDPETADTSVSESSVSLENLVKVSADTLPPTTLIPLEYALVRGHAAL